MEPKDNKEGIVIGSEIKNNIYSNMYWNTTTSLASRNSENKMIHSRAAKSQDSYCICWELGWDKKIAIPNLI